jgi:hypothetical protein
VDSDGWLSNDFLDDDWLDVLDDLVAFNWFTTNFSVESVLVVSGVVNDSLVTVSTTKV